MYHVFSFSFIESEYIGEYICDRQTLSLCDGFNVEESPTKLNFSETVKSHSFPVCTLDSLPEYAGASIVTLLVFWICNPRNQIAYSVLS